MNSMIFLINTIFSLYLMVVLLRFWLQWAKADFYNPFSQFISKATNPFLRPLRRVIPGWGGYDIAALVLALLVVAAKLLLIQLVSGGGFPLLPLIFAIFKSLVFDAMQLVTYVLILRAILSWVSQGNNPVEQVMHQLTEPMLAPIRRLLPPMGGFDLSILVLLILMQLLPVLFGDVSGLFF
ncbi:MAG: YggT family protein [Algicola sp.]|nr:YggT family protein [Algicola sp.]